MMVKMSVKAGKCQGDIHHAGQSYVVNDTTPGGICLGAWNAVAPCLVALKYGANFDWEDEDGVAIIHCPDPKGIVFELRRIDEGNADS